MPTTLRGCPPAADWAALVGRRVPAGRETVLVAHLETCADCQQAVDACAADPAVWSRAARHLDTTDRGGGGALTAALDRVLHDLAAPRPDWVLDLLAPGDRPGNLGRLGPYDVTAVVGRGGMGVVLKAHDPKLGRTVALKVPTFADRSAALERFAREARAAAAVEHPNVLRIHAIEAAGPVPYLVMEYAPGGSLEDRLAGGPVPAAEAVRVAAAVARGLAAAHAVGLVHRDVKPGNVLFAADGTVKLSDFGLARALHDARLTRDGTLAGTPEYMAPEQARGEAAGPAADLFGLGSLLYAMLTGRPPFRADGALATLKQVCEAEPEPVPGAPRWLADLVRHLHAKDPAARPASAAAVAEALARGRSVARRPGRRRVLAGIGAAAVVVLLIGIGIWQQGRGGGHPWDPEPPTPPTPVAPRSVLFVLPSKDFSYLEYHGVWLGLTRAGIGVVVAGPSLTEVEPDRRRPDRVAWAVAPDRPYDQVTGDRYRAVFFCGGLGFEEFRAGGRSAAVADRLVREAETAGRIVAAFGSAPAVLADGGWLRGRRATCYAYGQPHGVFIAALRRGGADWVDEPVVWDEPYLTGRDPADTYPFTRRLIELLGPP